jgi:hypothetical protein
VRRNGRPAISVRTGLSRRRDHRYPAAALAVIANPRATRRETRPLAGLRSQRHRRNPKPNVTTMRFASLRALLRQWKGARMGATARASHRKGSARWTNRGSRRHSHRSRCGDLFGHCLIRSESNDVFRTRPDERPRRDGRSPHYPITVLSAPVQADSKEPNAVFEPVERLCPAPRYAYLSLVDPRAPGLSHR